MSYRGQRRKSRLPGIIFCIVGIVFLIVGIMFRSSVKEKESWTGEVVGVIVDNVKSNSKDDSTYFPIVEYEVDGEVYTYKSNMGTNPPRYRVGEEVTVIYDESNPYRASLPTSIDKWFVRIFTGIGILLLVFGVPIALFGIKTTFRETNVRM